MADKFDIIAETINTRRFAIVFMSFVLGGTYLSFIIAYKIHYAPIAPIGLVVFAILPILLMKRISLLFTKEIKITFCDNRFSIFLYNLNNGLEISKVDYEYKDVQSCIVKSTQNQYSTITLNMLDETIKITFKKITSSEPSSVSETVFRNIKERNKGVQLLPTFFLSDSGTNYIVGTGLLMVALLIFHIFYSPESSPLTFIVGVSIFVNILIKRRKDLETFRKLGGQA